MKSYFLLACVLAVGCGDAAGKAKKPLIVEPNNTTSNNNAGTNNGTTSACCAGLQCGGSTTCEDVVCGTCDETSICNESQQCEELPADGPRIIDLSINTTMATPSTTLTISAIVTDPDGIDDLIGGTLKSPTGASYGAFQTSAAEGSYELMLTWTQLNTVQPILFDAPITRDIIAEFYDQAGNRVQRSLSLTLACDVANGAACEPGQCFNLNTDNDHCGSCGNAVTGDVYCDQGQPACSDGDYCSATEVCSGRYEVKACGDCSNNCEARAAQLGFTFENENAYLGCAEDGTQCEASVISTVAKSCIAICGAATCSGASASFAESGVSASCETDWSEPRWVRDYGALQLISCYCHF